MSRDQTADAVQPDSVVIGATPKSVVVEPGQPQKGRRTRRASTKERVSKVASTPGRRSSIYRGVTRHRWTGRYEAHLWDKSCWNQSQNKKGRQVYLGAYDDEEAAARAYDLAALKYWGPGTIINFPLTDYTRELEDMGDVSKEEYLASLRRKSSGFSRGVSKYRGVARHHHNGRWEARIGRIFGNKYLYLGTYSTQEEAAAAYDMAAIEYRGLNAVTNFDLSRYIRWLRPGQAGGTLAPVVDSNGMVASVQTQDSFVQEPPASSAHDKLEQNEKWEASQACEGGHNEPATVAPQSNSPSGTALGLLYQSDIFKKMLDSAPAIDGVEHQTLVDQSPDQPNTTLCESHCDIIPIEIDQMDMTSDVKHELSFQEEERHVFDHNEMSLMGMEQPEDLTFGASSALDRMFSQSDIFPYFPVTSSPAEMMDQGSTLLDSISSFNSLYLPYAISTCS